MYVTVVLQIKLANNKVSAMKNILTQHFSISFR